jgi:hypothetical protein
VNSVPTATQAVGKNKTLTFSSANGNGISVSDPYAALLQVTLTVSHGTLTLGSVTGLTFVLGNGKNDTTMTFQGTVAAINAALNGLTYKPASSYVGSDALTITSTDLGTGLSDNDVVAILVGEQKK